MSDNPATEQEALQALDPQAAAELAQELTLVARAMFAQLLPDTAMNAVAGISSPAATAQEPPVDAVVSTPVTGPVAAPATPLAAPAPVPVVSVRLPSVPVPVPVPLPVPMAPAPRIPAQPAAAVEPGHTPPVAVPIEADPPSKAAEPVDAPVKQAPRTMAMLEEITFLDE